MNNAHFSIELLSDENINILTTMSLELWSDCIYQDELEAWGLVKKSPDNYCALAKINDEYAGFIHVTIRNDYVEGSDTCNTPYLEAIYVRGNYRKINVASHLLSYAEEWIQQKGFTQLASDTELDNQGSQEFHTKMGFCEVSRIVCYLKNLKGES